MINLENINKVNIQNINNTLLIVLVILVIFCICLYIYNSFNIKNIIKYDNFNNSIDNKIVLLELMAKAKENALYKINKMNMLINVPNNKTNNTKEKFIVDERLLQENNAIDYYNSLNAIQSWLDNSYKGENGILAQISLELQNASVIHKKSKEEILNLLTNIYIIAYINSINRQTAEAYKVFLQYNKPEKNKYYKQYIS